MNKYDKIKKTCRVTRLVLGTVLIAIGIYLNNPWFYLGIIPLIAGIANFCPICIISKKCTI
ncbi:MAG: DUF2892 domain-containing protein [Epsilonproteobacteria bacterium]|nr:DUF2892 domain-containing protein [Campylobacterota bacterium]